MNSKLFRLGHLHLSHLHQPWAEVLGTACASVLAMVSSGMGSALSFLPRLTGSGAAAVWGAPQGWQWAGSMVVAPLMCSLPSMKLLHLLCKNILWEDEQTLLL